MQHPSQIWHQKWGLHLLNVTGLCPVHREYAIRSGADLCGQSKIGGFCPWQYDTLLLRVQCTLLPHCHGLQQPCSSACILPHSSDRQVLQANSGYDCRCLVRPKAILPLEVLFRLSHRARRRCLHVQSRQRCLQCFNCTVGCICRWTSTAALTHLRWLYRRLSSNFCYYYIRIVSPSNVTFLSRFRIAWKATMAPSRAIWCCGWTPGQPWFFLWHLL